MIEQLLSLLKHDKQTERSIALHEPKFAGNEWRYVKQCLDENFVSSVGSFVTKFEHELSQITQANFVIATNNGTSALHICLLLAGVTSQDEVLTSPLSFIATSNAISYCGATPHYVDINPINLAVDPTKLHQYLKTITRVKDGVCINKHTKRPIKALIATHIFGHPADLDGLQDVCQRFGIKLIEDAAQTLGSQYKGQPVGHHGIAGALSFNGNKVITTGGGGAILTDDKELASLAKHLTTTGKVSHPWRYSHDCVAYNYRLPNINAALGLAQLEQLPEFLTKKRQLAQYYINKLAHITTAKVLQEPTYAHSNYWLNTLILEPDELCQRDALIEVLASYHVMCRPAWDLHHHARMYQHCPCGPLDYAEAIQPRIINLPSSVDLIDGVNEPMAAEKEIIYD